MKTTFKNTFSIIYTLLHQCSFCTERSCLKNILEFFEGISK